MRQQGQAGTSFANVTTALVPHYQGATTGLAAAGQCMYRVPCWPASRSQGSRYPYRAYLACPITHSTMSGAATNSLSRPLGAVKVVHCSPDPSCPAGLCQWTARPPSSVHYCIHPSTARTFFAPDLSQPSVSPRLTSLLGSLFVSGRRPDRFYRLLSPRKRTL